ncbi:nuclear factor erythroid 2-related factor 2a [Colossoma macropomum]|uniref:nuclear factor erythroid 2-related factor 2a n=1 Tax=Colossoma macropomum TaxID=42526 RepID=UPI0018641CF6|nr:nuclear factor erythroid 2-related factor 2a [Colossoma macropomum]
MMEIELPKMNPSQQDMDLIDILWRQDIDLGAGREVFDFSYRQKEVQLQRQRELEEEKRQQRVREQEKALLAQLQLDEETGEFVPRPTPANNALTHANTAPAEITQNVAFTEENGDAMSFDECMQLLAETFPLVESAETAAPCLDPSIPPSTDNSHVMMPGEMPMLTQNPLMPGPMDQTWMDLQHCLNIQEMLDISGYVNPAPATNIQESNYSQYLPELGDIPTNTAEMCPPAYINTFDGAFNSVVPPSLNQISLKAEDINEGFASDDFSDIFYPDMEAKVNSATLPCDGANTVDQLEELSSDPLLKPMDLHSLSPGDFSVGKPEAMAEFPDSDSGLSLDASPKMSSPEKSLNGDGSFGFSDSDMDDTEDGPESAESDYAEMFPLLFQSDSPQQSLTEKSPVSQAEESEIKRPKSEPAEASGFSKPPFTKDKQKKRSEARISRDEQRAKTLQIPFTVDMIINLPVDDFNELMSKHQLNEAQLALVRDIRRRGKNKVAAQNCRKRKMENIVGLEYELDSLKEEKERLMKEKSENSNSLREMKQQLNSLYLEVFSMLKDEQGKPYSPNDYSLQQTSDGSVFLVPRIKKTLIKSD